MALTRAALALALAVTVACREDEPSVVAAPVRSARASPSAPPGQRPQTRRPDASRTRTGLQPLFGAVPLTTLSVEGFRDAVVSLPLGTSEPVPLYVALHGNFDRPEWQCNVWRDLVGNEAFVLCPRGIPRNDVAQKLDRWTYAAFAMTEAEVLAAVAAVERAYPDRVDATRAALIGFSLGAAHVARLLERHGAEFSRGVLIEGGGRGFSASMARRFAAAGGDAVLFVCAQPVCTSRAQGAKRLLEQNGARARVAYAGNVGHAYDGLVARAVEQNLAWLWRSSAEPAR